MVATQPRPRRFSKPIKAPGYRAGCNPNSQPPTQYFTKCLPLMEIRTFPRMFLHQRMGTCILSSQEEKRLNKFRNVFVCGCLEARYQFNSFSKQRIFGCSLQCQN
jgi:hypothetical protein